MEDRYLFKAKRTDNGEWVQGYLFDDGFENALGRRGAEAQAGDKGPAVDVGVQDVCHVVD